jgi:hypothetical protein
MTKALKALAQRRVAFALVLALTIFGAVYGFAATLNLGTQQLSANNLAVGSCESGTATATYNVAYDATLGGYKVSGVNVTGLDAACANKTVSVTLSDGTGASLGELTGVVPGGGGTLNLGAPASTVSAKAVTGVAVAING